MDTKVVTNTLKILTKQAETGFFIMLKGFCRGPAPAGPGTPKG